MHGKTGKDNVCMGKYDNLVKSLRGTTSVSKRKMLDGAADAIEHLEKQVAHKEEIRLAQAKTIMDLRGQSAAERKRVQELEEAMLQLLNEVAGGSGEFVWCLCAEERAGSALGIRCGDSVDEAWARYREKWQGEGNS